jgi:hypothetical protein
MKWKAYCKERLGFVLVGSDSVVAERLGSVRKRGMKCHDEYWHLLGRMLRVTSDAPSFVSLEIQGV